MSVLIGIFTFLLVLVSFFMVLVILMQRAKSDGGVGAALGGGMAEAAFGGGSSNVLSKATTYAAVAFFVLSFALFLAHIHRHRTAGVDSSTSLPAMPELAPVPGDASDSVLDETNGGVPQVSFPSVDTTTESTGDVPATVPEAPDASLPADSSAGAGDAAPDQPTDTAPAP